MRHSQPLPIAARANEDPRAHRTREAIIHAFVGLVMARPLSEITVADVVARAGVGRSTFYEHFSNKADLLAESFQAPFAPLADLLSGRASAPHAAAFLAHVADNRQMIARLVDGALLRRTQDVLARMVEVRFSAKPGMGSARRAIVAAQLSAGAIAAVRTWLGRGCDLDAADVAGHLERVATLTLGSGENGA